MQAIPTRRGLHLLDRYQLSTSFPFGFIRRAIGRQQKDSVLIYPPVAQVDPKLLSLCLSAESTGSRMQPRRGGTDEFYGVKEFRQGENPRWIYWRRTARTGTLVAKEMTQVAPPRLLLLIDTFLASRTLEEHAHVERAIAMAGSLIMRAEDQGIAVGLHAWSGDWLMIPASRGKRHVRDLMTTLARLPLNTVADGPTLIEKTRRHLRPGTTAILFTPRDLEQTLADQVRANWVVVSAVSPQARRWFRFPKDLDFSQAMPFDQLPPESLKT
jgi:uncharacterized protein (DUF58 family)